MTSQLHATKHQLTEQVADMQRISRGIESHVDTHRVIREARAELVGCGRVVDETTFGQFGEDVHPSMLARRTARVADHLHYVAHRRDANGTA